MSATNAMDLVRPSAPLRVLARLMLVVLALTAVTLTFVPWQQTAPGSGRVVAYAPDERRQTIEAPIEGRVLRWYVREGSVVKLVDVYAATIPDFPFKPGLHVNYQETVLHVRDGLPKMKDFPAEMGGSGETLPE